MYSKMMLAQALRNSQAPMGEVATGGTQMPAQTGIPAMQSYGVPEFTGMNEGMNKDLGAAAGKAGQWMKDNYFTDNSAAGKIGPEVVKMGGQVPATNDTNRGFGGMWDDLKGSMPAGMGLDALKNGGWKDFSPVAQGWGALKSLWS